MRVKLLESWDSRSQTKSIRPKASTLAPVVPKAMLPISLIPREAEYTRLHPPIYYHVLPPIHIVACSFNKCRGGMH